MNIIIDENNLQIIKKNCNQKGKKTLKKKLIIENSFVKNQKPKKLRIIKCSKSTSKFILEKNKIDYEINGKLVDELFLLKNKSKLQYK
jgi:hypothetical protein